MLVNHQLRWIRRAPPPRQWRPPPLPLTHTHFQRPRPSACTARLTCAKPQDSDEGCQWGLADPIDTIALEGMMKA